MCCWETLGHYCHMVAIWHTPFTWTLLQTKCTPSGLQWSPSRTMCPATLQKLHKTESWNMTRCQPGLQIPKSRFDCASVGYAKTSQIHGGLTLQHTGFANNALVPDITGHILRSCVHALMGKRQVKSTVEPPWNERYQNVIHMNTRSQCFQEENGTATRWSILFTSVVKICS